MNFVSLFSGIGGFDLGFERAGLTCVAQVENNAHANQILAKHWPSVARYEDVKHVGSSNLPANVDVLCGGFPCQDVSVAGKRAGLAGERSGLWFEFLRILTELAPRIVVIENVPGLLSSNAGADFAVILQGLVECGYRVLWRVLDAQYFGVAQRRRRVFLVASLGDGRCAQILFERESGTGDIETSGNKRQRTAATVSASTPSRRNGGSNPTEGHFVTAWDSQRRRIHDIRGTSPTLSNEEGRGQGVPLIALHAGNGEDISPALTNEGHDGSEDGRGRHAFVCVDLQQVTSFENRSSPTPFSPPLTPEQRVVAFNPNASSAVDQPVRQDGNAGTLSKSRPEGIFGGFGVRRLTPLECERLQGFPDHWTEGLSDSARYQRLGNAVCVSVAEWLGHRIVEAYS